MGTRCILFPLQNTSQASVLVKFLCTRVGLSGPGSLFSTLVMSITLSSGSPDSAATTYPVSTFVTHLVHLRGGAVRVDVALTSVRLSLLSPCRIGVFLLI